MKTSTRQPRFLRVGFVLMATLLMMVLLVIIAIGLLSLSTVSVRNASLQSAEGVARSNARMALMIAIGELQTCTGQDTRVTASANLVDENNPIILGVWRSWEGTDHTSNGRPIAPDYNSKGQSVQSGGRFEKWLVSSASTLDGPRVDDAINLARTSCAADVSEPSTAPMTLQLTSFLNSEPTPLSCSPS